MTDTEKDQAASTVAVPNDTLERLKAELRKAQPFENGTLVRFVSVEPATGQHFHYAALFASGRWWFTGQGNSHFPKHATQHEFSALIMAQGHRIIGLELATSFAPIEL